MSEYQYYEFRTIDRPLTDEEQAAMRQLSSRVVLTPPAPPLPTITATFGATLKRCCSNTSTRCFILPIGAVAG